MIAVHLKLGIISCVGVVHCLGLRQVHVKLVQPTRPLDLQSIEVCRVYRVFFIGFREHAIQARVDNFGCIQKDFDRKALRAKVVHLSTTH